MDIRKISELLNEKLESVDIITIENFDKQENCIKWFDETISIFRQLPDSKEDKEKQLTGIVSKAKTRRHRINNSIKRTGARRRYQDVSNSESKLLHEKIEADAYFLANLRSLIKTTIWEIEQFSNEFEDYLKGDNLLQTLIEASRNTPADKNDDFVILKTDYGYCLIKHPSFKGNKIKTFESEIYRLRDQELLNIRKINDTEHFYLSSKASEYFDEMNNEEAEIASEQWFQKSIEELLQDNEGQYLEFKETLEINLKTGKSNNQEGRKSLETICAFANAKGGILLLGVDNDGNPKGLEKDFRLLGQRDDEDSFELKIRNKINDHIDPKPLGILDILFKIINNKIIARINVHKSDEPVYFNEDVFVREGNTNRKLSPKDAIKYIQKRFPL